MAKAAKVTKLSEKRGISFKEMVFERQEAAYDEIMDMCEKIKTGVYDYQKASSMIQASKNRTKHLADMLRAAALMD